jgi:tetratricopeptide (TPR) repeat protein
MEGISMSVCRPKIFLFLLFLVSVIFCIQARGTSFDVGIYGGGNNAAMMDYNSRIDSLNSFNSANGAQATLKKFTYEPGTSLILSGEFETTAGRYAVYLKNDWLIIEERGNNAKWENGLTAQSLNGDYSVLYSAAGARYYYSPEGMPFIEFYINADAGVCGYFSNYASESTFKSDGTPINDERKEWKTAIPAASAGAGGRWWLGNGFGIGLEAGYRLASGKVMVSVTNTNGDAASQGEDVVNYSGPFVNAGVIYRFGGDTRDKKSGPVTDTVDPQYLEITAKLYSDAQKYYEEGLFNQAAEKNSEAMKLSPDDGRVIEQAKAIKAASEKNGGGENVDRLKEEAENLRRLKNYPGARLKYLEIRAIEPENGYAVFYLKNFDDKASQFLKKAREYLAADNAEKALDAAAKAVEYAPDDAQAAALYASIARDGMMKKKADRIFNRAVDSFSRGEYEIAAGLWKEVLNINPSDEEAKKNMDKAAEKAGENLEEKSMEAQKAHEEAVALYKIGNMDSAAAKCEFVLRLDPDDLDSKKMLEDIKKIRKENNKEAIIKR